jgi:hypothetical protein
MSTFGGKNLAWNFRMQLKFGHPRLSHSYVGSTTVLPDTTLSPGTILNIQCPQNCMCTCHLLYVSLSAEWPCQPWVLTWFWPLLHCTSLVFSINDSRTIACCCSSIILWYMMDRCSCMNLGTKPTGCVQYACLACSFCLLVASMCRWFFSLIGMQCMGF